MEVTSGLPEVENRKGAPISRIAFATSPDRLATADSDLKLTLWDNGDPPIRTTLDRHIVLGKGGDRVRSIVFSRESNRYYMAVGRSVAAVDATSGEIEWAYDSPARFGFLTNTCTGVAILALEHILAVYEDGTMVMLSGDGDVKSRWFEHEGPTFVSPVDDDVAVGAGGMSLTMWSMSGNLMVSRGLKERPTAFAVSRRGRVVAVRNGQYIDWFHSSSLERLGREHVGGGAPVMAAANRSAHVAYATREGATLMDLKTNEKKTIGAPDRVTALAFSPNDEVLMAGLANGALTELSAS
jgi:WD40 repeat protein